MKALSPELKRNLLESCEHSDKEIMVVSVRASRPPKRNPLGPDAPEMVGGWQWSSKVYQAQYRTAELVSWLKEDLEVSQ